MRSGLRDRVIEAVERHRLRLAAAAAVLAVLVGLLALSPVRTVLRESFTRIPQPYTAMYFTASPSIDGTVLHVPLTVAGVDTGQSVYGVRVWTVNAAGKVSSSTTAQIKWNGHSTAGVITMPIKADAAVVWVSLDDTQESLHYRIATS